MQDWNLLLARSSVKDVGGQVNTKRQQAELRDETCRLLATGAMLCHPWGRHRTPTRGGHHTKQLHAGVRAGCGGPARPKVRSEDPCHEGIVTSIAQLVPLRPPGRMGQHPQDGALATGLCDALVDCALGDCGTTSPPKQTLSCAMVAPAAVALGGALPQHHRWLDHPRGGSYRHGACIIPPINRPHICPN